MGSPKRERETVFEEGTLKVRGAVWPCLEERSRSEEQPLRKERCWRVCACGSRGSEGWPWWGGVSRGGGERHGGQARRQGLAVGSRGWGRCWETGLEPADIQAISGGSQCQGWRSRVTGGQTLDAR